MGRCARIYGIGAHCFVRGLLFVWWNQTRAWDTLTLGGFLSTRIEALFLLPNDLWYCNGIRDVLSMIRASMTCFNNTVDTGNKSHATKEVSRSPPMRIRPDRRNLLASAGGTEYSYHRTIAFSPHARRVPVTWARLLWRWSISCSPKSGALSAPRLSGRVLLSQFIDISVRFVKNVPEDRCECAPKISRAPQVILVHSSYGRIAVDGIYKHTRNRATTTQNCDAMAQTITWLITG